MAPHHPAKFCGNKYFDSPDMFLLLEEQNSTYLVNFRHYRFSRKHMTFHALTTKFQNVDTIICQYIL